MSAAYLLDGTGPVVGEAEAALGGNSTGPSPTAADPHRGPGAGSLNGWRSRRSPWP